jgi:hypothetical protein
MKKMLLTGVIIIVIFIGAVYLTNPKAEAPPPPKTTPIVNPPPPKTAPIVNPRHPKTVPVVMRGDLPPITPGNASLGKGKGDTTPVQDTNPVQAGKNPWGGNVLPRLGDGVHAYGSSFGQLLETLWNPANGNLYGRTVELLQITNAEASAISDELNKMQKEYINNITTNGVMEEETDTKATFLVAPFDTEAESANQEFLKNLQSQVSEETYNIMLDAMPTIVESMGHNGEPLKIIITKDARKKDVFRVDLRSEINKRKSTGSLVLYPVTRNDINRLYGRLIETNKSHILE